MNLHHDVNTISLIDGLAPGVFSSQRVKSDEDSMALFAQVYWDLTDRLRLGAGLRFTTIDIDLQSENTSYFLQNVHPYHYAANLANAAITGGFVANGSDSWTEPGGKVSLDYKLAPDVMLYAYYARGFKSGGFNGRITDPLDIGPFAPEFIDSYEVGLRSDWFDRRLRANVAVFYNKWDDMQVPQSVFRGNPPQASSTILNAASATSQGVEVELELAPTSALSLKASIGYLDATYDTFADAGVDYSGRPTPYAPEWTGSFTASYEIDAAAGVITPSFQYTYTADRWAAFTQYAAEHLDEVNLVNANLSYEPNGSNWTVSLWATNLFDEKYVTSALTVPPLFSFASFGAPRQYGVELRFDF